MKRSLCLAVLGASLLAPLGAPAEPVIYLDVSVKVIVNPANGQVPSSMNDALLRESFDDMNRWLANTWRGYRVRLVDLEANQNFRRIGGLNDTTGPSYWYALDLKWNATNNLLFEIEAKEHKALYAWNDSAINLYFNNGGYSSAQFPWSGRDLVQSAYPLFLYDANPPGGFTERYKVAGNLLHEFGHFLGLCHTFEPCGELPDTAADPCSSGCSRDEAVVRESIAQHAFGSSYSALDDEQTTRVDNTANNAMSYYQLFYDDPAQGKVLTDAERFGPTRFVFTELQMDTWGDYANGGRAPVASGRMIFVKPGIAGGDGSSANEFQLIDDAVGETNEAGGDILLLRPGVYGRPLFTERLTLRATRAGSAVVGR